MKKASVYAAFVFVFTVTGAVASGAIISVMWGWFITPLLGIAPPTIAQAIGLTLVVGLFQPALPKGNSNDSFVEEMLTSVVSSIINPLILLFLGKILTMFL